MGSVPIAITGMHRSGTSMITRALHDSGLHLIGTGAEELIDAAEDNPEGFWENKAIVACNDELLEATGGAWDNPPDLPPQAVDDPRVAHVAEPATAAIAALSEYERWGFKDPRVCLTAAYWLDLVPDLRFIVCVRHPLEVALSLKRRNQNSYSLGLALWERYYATVLDLLPAHRRIVTHYDTYFLDPQGEIARLCAFAELTPAPPRVRDDLRHHTTRVGLGDAGVSASLQALYERLCHEANVIRIPEPPSDEGRVRRLILDGAIAARHAEQRQAAVERLEEREAQFQEENRERIRDLEARLATARQEGIARLEALRDLNRSVARTEAVAARTEELVARIDGRTRAMQVRIESGPLRRAARAIVRRLPASAQVQVRRGRQVVRRGIAQPVPTATVGARRAVRRLPPPARQRVLRVRSIVARGVADPRRSARILGRRLEPTARSAATRLPEGRARRAVADPVATAHAIGRRLPPPAQRAARRMQRATLRLRAGAGSGSQRAEPVRRASAPPKGPAFKEWKAGYERMVAATVPAGSAWLVVAPGSPTETRDARTPRATRFPNTPKGRPFADDLAAIAHLEALRFEGYRHLVVPEGSRPWFRRQAELRDHVSRTYRELVDREGAGAVFDLFEPALPGSRSVRGEIDRMTVGLTDVPAVLDWTELDLGEQLAGMTTFKPRAGSSLPYLDRSVEIVVVDESKDPAEARRVASHGVITVAAGPTGIDVRDVDDLVPAHTSAPPRVLVWAEAPDRDDAWSSQLAARAAEAGADLRFAEIDAAALAAAPDYDVVALVERHVLPLPGAIEAGAAFALAEPRGAVAAKVLRADGRLEAAGGTVFSDRSVALIAGASSEVRGPWHEYARPVCWAPGIVLAPSPLLAAVPGPGIVSGRTFLREWCAEVWSRGATVIYEPSVAAVRVTGDGGEPSVPLQSSSWQRVLDLRPNRPDDLNDGAWRYLIAHDDVEACRR